MTRFTHLLSVAFAAGVISAQTPMPEFQEEPQPGLLRVSGIAASDKVLLDGEFVGDGKRMARFGNRLFINPGTYTVTILAGDNTLACHSRVSVRENATAVARCDRRGDSNEHEVD